MSEENVRLIADQFEAINARNFAAVVDAYADDVVLSLHGEIPMALGESAVGKKAVVEWFGDWFRTFDSNYRFEIEEPHDLGDRVFVAGTHHSAGRVSGVPVTLRGAWIFTLRDGKVVRCDAYTSRAEAVEAAGLSE